MYLEEEQENLWLALGTLNTLVHVSEGRSAFLVSYFLMYHLIFLLIFCIHKSIYSLNRITEIMGSVRTDIREYPTLHIFCLFEGDCLISFNCILLCHLPVALLVSICWWLLLLLLLSRFSRSVSSYILSILFSYMGRKPYIKVYLWSKRNFSISASCRGW